MEQEQITLTITKAVLNSLADAVSLLEWSMPMPEVGVVVGAGSDGELFVQCEGPTVATVRAKLGDTVIWDGTAFTVETPLSPAPPPRYTPDEGATG